MTREILTDFLKDHSLFGGGRGGGVLKYLSETLPELDENFQT